MIFGLPTQTLSSQEINALSPRLLAHLGDAVFHLFEREREIAQVTSAAQLHKSAVRRSSAVGQAGLLDMLIEHLSDGEREIVRRARNVKPPNNRRPQQAAYRKATAFEALLGYLYLSDQARLRQILDWTRPENNAQSASAGINR